MALEAINGAQKEPNLVQAEKPGFMPAVKNLFSAVQEKSISAKNIIVEKISNVCESVKSLALRIWSAVRDFFVARYQSTKQMFTNCLDKISEKVGSRFYRPQIEALQRADDQPLKVTEIHFTQPKRKASQSSVGTDFERVINSDVKTTPGENLQSRPADNPKSSDGWCSVM